MTPFINEAQILDPDFRKQVIKEIVYAQENIDRRAEALKRHEIYRDQNKKWVMDAIIQEGFNKDTIEQMRNRATNISIARKIVNKLAQTYVGGVERKVSAGEDKYAQPKPVEKPEPVPPVEDGEEEPAVEEPKPEAIEQEKINPDQVSLDLLVDELDFNTKMKKADRFRQLFKNALVGCIPVLDERETRKSAMASPGAVPVKKNSLKVRVLAPWEYDVIEDPNDAERPAIVIISDFPEQRDMQAMDRDGVSGMRTSANLGQTSDGINATIADARQDKGQGDARRFIWWSDTYHFTTDIKGNIVPPSPADLLNPIKVLPWVNIADDQDGNYWAQGGEDVIDGSILINKQLTDVNFISFVQGWGQLVIAGENIPKKLVGGPNNPFVFEKTPGGGDVQVWYATSNPPIESWLENVRMALAMLLSTNNLSVRAIATTLDTADPASGVALMVENLDILTEATDVQETFRDKEPVIWEIVRLWHSTYSKSSWLTDCFQKIQPMKSSDIAIKFMQTKPPMSEKEKLEELKLRKDLGIATLRDLLKKDNPDLSDAELDKKVAELESDKSKADALVAKTMKETLGNGIKESNPGNKNADDASKAFEPGVPPGARKGMEPTP